MEDTGRATQLPLDVFAPLGRRVRPEGAGARPADVLQQPNKRPERVSRTETLAVISQHHRFAGAACRSL